MRKLIISSAAVLLTFSADVAMAQESEEKDVAEATVSSDEAGVSSLYKNFDCSGCGGKTKK